MSARVLVIAVDGADGRLLRTWTAAGALPALAGIMDRGATGTLHTPPGFGDDAVWASFWTGRPVGEHGRYFWDQRRHADRRPVDLYAIPDSEPFWCGLARQGRRVAVLDIPKCPVTTLPGGVHVCDWLVHGRSHGEPISRPEALAGDLVARFGAAPPSRCAEIVTPMSDDEARAVTARLVASAGMKGAAAAHLLAADAWDVVLVAFKEAHCVSHMFWDLVDPDHPGFDPERDARLGAPVMAVFRAIDAEIGRLARPRADLLVFAPLGMATNITGNHLLDDLLGRFDRLYDAPYRSGTSQRVCSSLPHNEASGAIRFHVAGRDPGGVVPPGGALAVLRTALARTLEAATDADSGRRVVDDVVVTADRCPGAQAAELPDLLVVWNRQRPFRAIRVPELGVVEAPTPSYRPGNHVPHGVYVATGAAAGLRDMPIHRLARVIETAVGR